jgi:hypothetical protein
VIRTAAAATASTANPVNGAMSSAGEKVMPAANWLTVWAMIIGASRVSGIRSGTANR